jgi:UDP-glucose 4-epimerase
MKCLVTGGAGFIGSNLVDKLIQDNHDVIVIDNLISGKLEYVNSKSKFYQMDICNLESIKPLFKNIDYVFHLAALPRVQFSIDYPILSNNTNLNGTLHVLKASLDAGVKKVIYSSTSAIYGDTTNIPTSENAIVSPICPYGFQKYFCELYCKMFSDIYNLPTISLRYFNVYGERQPFDGDYSLVLGKFLKQHQNNKPLTIINTGEQRRDFISITDVINANLLSAQNETLIHGEVINIGAGKNYSVNEIAKMIGGPTINIGKRIEPFETLGDISLAKKVLNWKPIINLEDWIQKIIQKEFI